MHFFRSAIVGLTALFSTGVFVFLPHATQAVQNPIGFNVHLHQRFPSYEWEDATQQLADGGFTWAREEFNWEAIEWLNDNFDFSSYDAVVDAYSEEGVKVLGLLTYSTWWSRNGDGGHYYYEPPEEAAWRDYVSTVAEHYAGTINHWEIWNEPNNGFWSGTEEEYIDLVRAAAEEIRAVNENAHIVLGGVSGTDSSFIRRVCGSLGNAVDIVGVHPYRHNGADFTATPEESADGLDSLLTGLRNVRAAVDDCWGKGTPIWVTEFGWPTAETGADGVTSVQQRNYLMRQVLQSLTVPGVERMFIYEFQDSGDDATNKEHHFGLINREGDVKKAWDGMRMLNEQLSGAAYKKTYHQLNGFESVYMHADQWSVGYAEQMSVRLTRYKRQMQMDYQFTAGSNSYALVNTQLPADTSASIIAFEARSKSSGEELLRLRVEDATGETLQYTLGTAPNSWQEYYIRLNKDYRAYWSGDGDGRVDFPIRGVQLVIDDVDESVGSSGRVSIRNMQSLKKPALYVYKFKKGKRPLIAAWSTSKKVGRIRSVRAGKHRMVRVTKSGIVTTNKKRKKVFGFTYRPAPTLLFAPAK